LNGRLTGHFLPAAGHNCLNLIGNHHWGTSPIKHAGWWDEGSAEARIRRRASNSPERKDTQNNQAQRWGGRGTSWFGTVAIT